MLAMTHLDRLNPEQRRAVEHGGPDFAAAGPYVQLRNPISSERTVMRRTVLAGVLDVAASNLRHTNDVRLFELGPVYLPQAGEPLPH